MDLTQKQTESILAWARFLNDGQLPGRGSFVRRTADGEVRLEIAAETGPSGSSLIIGHSKRMQPGSTMCLSVEDIKVEIDRRQWTGVAHDGVTPDEQLTPERLLSLRFDPTELQQLRKNRGGGAQSRSGPN